MLQISQKTFLIVTIALLFVVSSALFTYHDRALDPSKTGDWWAIRFTSLEDHTNLAFEIENYSDTTTGTYQVFFNNTLQEEKDIVVESNAITAITPSVSPQDATRVRLVLKLGDKEQSLTR